MGRLRKSGLDGELPMTAHLPSAGLNFRDNRLVCAVCQVMCLFTPPCGRNPSSCSRGVSQPPRWPDPPSSAVQQGFRHRSGRFLALDEVGMIESAIGKSEALSRVILEGQWLVRPLRWAVCLKRSAQLELVLSPSTTEAHMVTINGLLVRRWMQEGIWQTLSAWEKS